MTERGFQVNYGPQTDRVQAAIARAAHEARAQLAELGWFGLSLEPGDVTRYEVFGVRRGIREFRIGFMAGDSGGGSAVVPRGSWLAADWLTISMGIENRHSAAVLADFLNVLFGHIEVTE